MGAGATTVGQTLRSDPQIGAVLAPSGGATPRTSARHALAVYWSVTGHAWDRYPHTVLLTRYTNTVYGQVRSDGGVKLVYVRRMAWAVIYRKVPIVPMGGPIGPNTPRPTPEPICDYVFFVDANTGSYMDAFSECPGRL
jgi:hypothetical protein